MNHLNMYGAALLLAVSIVFCSPIGLTETGLSPNCTMCDILTHLDTHIQSQADYAENISCRTGINCKRASIVIRQFV